MLEFALIFAPIVVTGILDMYVHGLEVEVRSYEVGLQQAKVH